MVLAKKNLNYITIREKMELDISMIWLKFPCRGKKPFILRQVYREFHLLNRQIHNNSGDPASQNAFKGG